MEYYIVRRRKRKQEKGLRSISMCVVAGGRVRSVASVTFESDPEGGEGKCHTVSRSIEGSLKA